MPSRSVIVTRPREYLITPALEYAGRDPYARATYTQHFGKKLVSECKFVAIHPIMSHE